MSRFTTTSSQKSSTEEEFSSPGSQPVKKFEVESSTNLIMEPEQESKNIENTVSSNVYSAPVKDDAPKNTDTSSNEKVDTKPLPVPSVSILEEWDDIDDLNVNILRGLYSYGFEKPSQIQKKTIPWIAVGRDVIGQARSGTGKTGAFCVGTLSRIDFDLNATQAIIMAPTHELARQHEDVCKSIGNYCKVRTHLLIGGTSIESDRNALTGEEKPQVIFACPGRLHDMLRRGYLDAKSIKIMCLDEADELLSSCFKDQLYHIIQFMRSDMQIAIFSATMPEEVKELTSRFMRQPHTVYMEKENLTVDAISQFYISLESDQQKFDVIKDIFSGVTISQTIIYCNSVKRVQDLTDALKQDGFPVSCIHSNFSEEQRKEIIKEFAMGKSRVLVSSDITARGIDVPQVNIVINFDLCKCKHKYLHRIGRSGRWGRKGVAINFITRRDQSTVKEIQDYYGIEIQPFPTDFVNEMKRLT